MELPSVTTIDSGSWQESPYRLSFYMLTDIVRCEISKNFDCG